MKITGRSSEVNVRMAPSDAGSGVRSLGNKGDIIEGIVRKVSDKVSIDFNGKEINFSKKTVSDAREGSSIKFQIMDVSDDRIVLKALGSPENAVNGNKVSNFQLETGQTVTGAGNQTSVLYSSLGTDEAGGQGNSADQSQESDSDEEYSNVANITADDIRSAADLCDELEEYNLEAFDRLLEAIKNNKMFEMAAIEGQHEKAEALRKTIEKTVIKNKLPDGVSKALAEYFVRYDIPVTKEKLEQIGIAYNQADRIENIDDKTIKYMLQSEYQITISNLYNASYMGSSVAVDQNMDQAVYEELKPQIEGILKASGYEASNENMARARWMIANDIPVNKENLDRQNILLELSGNGIDRDELTKKIMESVAESVDPAKAMLSDPENDRIRQAVADFKNMDADVVDTVVNEGRKLCLESLRKASKDAEVYGRDATGSENGAVVDTSATAMTAGIASGSKGSGSGSDSYGGRGYDRRREEQPVDIRVVTARRQLEEIRLKMTIEGARALSAGGMDIDTSELEDIVEGLRQIERENIQNSFAARGITVTDEEAELITQTMDSRRTIAEAPAYTLGMTRQLDIAGDGTLTTYTEVARNETVLAKRAGEAYETLMTAPRSDMGDSIQKAFVNVDSLIEETGLEVNEANQRIVKILAQNNMEISSDNIQLMQNYDAKMQYMLKGLTPETTFELIQSGNNPLTMSLDELNMVIAEISENMNRERKDEGESSYSRFLWKLEKEDRITEEERESYIGICRLVRHITKNDTAALGAVVKSGRKLSLRNLMTEVRSRRDSGMDEKIDDSYGGRDSRVISDIDKQIGRAFEAQNTPGASDNEVSAGTGIDITHETYTGDRIYEALSPSSLYDISGGNIENIMDMSLDELADNLEKSQNADNSVEYEYYDHIAKEISESVRDKDAMEFIKAFDMEPTLFNLNAARQMMSTGQTVLADMFGMYRYSDRSYSEEAISEYEESVEGLVDALEDEETMQVQTERVTAAAKKLLGETENGIIRNDDLDTLRLMNTGIRFNRLMSDRRSYEIPIVTESGITNINLTLVRAENEQSAVNIRLNSEIYGNISIDYTIHGDRLQGLILTENNADGIEGLYEDVEEAASECGYKVVSVNRGIHNVRGAYEPGTRYRRRNTETEGVSRADTADMYRLSKNIIHRIAGRL